MILARATATLTPISRVKSAGVILLAAGSGQRFGGRVSKQFLSFKQHPLFLHSFRVFNATPAIKEIVLVVAEEKISAMQKIVGREKTSKQVIVVAGGKFRGESVKNGLKSFDVLPDVVLVHDAARPLVTRKIIEDVIRATLKSGVALAAWPLSDTLKLESGRALVKKTIPRKNLWQAQTPQGFTRERAKQCLLSPSETATDDVSLAEKKGYTVTLVPASPTNIKVTYPIDFHIAEALADL